MKKTLLSMSVVGMLALATTGCANNQGTVAPTSSGPLYSVAVPSTSQVQDTVAKIATEMVSNLKLPAGDTGSIAITSFVNLDDLSKTSQFGRILGEGFFNALHSKGLNVMDFRRQTALSINANGEYFITRNAKKIKSPVENKYVLVGTYAPVVEGIQINARIIDNTTGRLVASSSTVYHSENCELFDLCVEPKPLPEVKPEPVRTIGIVDAECSNTASCAR